MLQNKSRCDEVSKEYGISCFTSIDDDLDYDAAIVSTSPSAHFSIIKDQLLRKKNVFTEINLNNEWYDELLKLSIDNGVKLFISSTLNYRKDIQFIKKKC